MKKLAILQRVFVFLYTNSYVKTIVISKLNLEKHLKTEPFRRKLRAFFNVHFTVFSRILVPVLPQIH
jgi:hypothetical protein